MSIFVTCASLDMIDFYEYDALQGDSRGISGVSVNYAIDGEMRLKWLVACWVLGI